MILVDTSITIVFRIRPQRPIIETCRNNWNDLTNSYTQIWSDQSTL